MFDFFQKHGLKMAVFIDIVIIIVVCCVRKDNWQWNDNKIIGELVQVAIAGFAAVNSILLLISLCSIPNSGWGQLSEQKTNVFLGCIVSIIASGYFVLKSIFYGS